MNRNLTTEGSLRPPEATSKDSLKAIPTEELPRKDLQTFVVERGIHGVAKQRRLIVGDKSITLIDFAFLELPSESSASQKHVFLGSGLDCFTPV